MEKVIGDVVYGIFFSLHEKFSSKDLISNSHVLQIIENDRRIPAVFDLILFVANLLSILVIVPRNWVCLECGEHKIVTLFAFECQLDELRIRTSLLSFKGFVHHIIQECNGNVTLILRVQNPCLTNKVVYKRKSVLFFLQFIIDWLDWLVFKHTQLNFIVIKRIPVEEEDTIIFTLEEELSLFSAWFGVHHPCNWIVNIKTSLRLEKIFLCDFPNFYKPCKGTTVLRVLRRLWRQILSKMMHLSSIDLITFLLKSTLFEKYLLVLFLVHLLIFICLIIVIIRAIIITRIFISIWWDHVILHLSHWKTKASLWVIFFHSYFWVLICLGNFFHLFLVDH